MRRLIPLILLAVIAWTPAPAGEPADSIEAVIADQIAAFQAEDLSAAFSFASPGIQSKFGNPQNFGRMVRQGYPMIWRPADWRWGALEQTPRGWVQTVMFQDAEGQLYEADYLMEQQTDGTWRIDGVRLRQMPGAAA